MIIESRYESCLKPSNFIFRELISSIIMGGIPSTLIILSVGFDGGVDFLRSLNPPSSLVWYMVLLVVGHLLIWCVNYYWFKPNEIVKSWVLKIHDVSDQVGFSLLGIYRAMAGAILVVIPSIWLSQSTAANFVMGVVCLLFAGGCVWMSCMLSYWQVKTSNVSPRQIIK